MSCPKGTGALGSPMCHMGIIIEFGTQPAYCPDWSHWVHCGQTKFGCSEHEGRSDGPGHCECACLGCKRQRHG